MVEGQVRLRHSELSGHYSSAVFLLFTIFTTIYGLLAYFSFVKFIRVSRDYENVWIALASVSVVFRTLAIILAWIIWLTKAGMGGKAPSQAFHQRFNVWLPYLQAAYPLTTIAALIFRLTMHLLIGKCHNGIADGFCNPHAQCGGMSATLSAELMSFPILVAFLLRDTRFEALLIAWLTAVSVLISFCVLLESPDLIISTVGYVFFSVLLCWDNESHHRELCTVLQELKQALVENEQLAQAAQALELRAMIGNVAHDMKTVHHYIYKTLSMFFFKIKIFKGVLLLFTAPHVDPEQH